MASDLEVVAAIGIAYLSYKKIKNRAGKVRRVWVKEWLANRETKSAYRNILSELYLIDKEEFRRYLRINTESYEELIEKLRPLITKQTTVMRKPISAEERLAVTLRYFSFLFVSYLVTSHW